MKILVIGATGMLGKPVAKELIAAGFDVTLLVRNPDKIRQEFPQVNLVKGDVFDKQSLLSAFSGMDAVYCNLSVSQNSSVKEPQPEREGIDNILAAAKETGVKRLAYLSSLVHHYEGMNGFHWWAFQLKLEAVRKIKSSGIPYSIFYPSTFMETFPYQMKQGKKIAMLGTSVAPMWFIAAADYARQVSRSFSLQGGENKEYIIQGPVAYTFDEAAEIFISNYKKEKLKIMKAPIGMLKFLGSFNRKFNYAWHICEALNKYPEKFEAQSAWDELGKPETSLEVFSSSL